MPSVLPQLSYWHLQNSLSPCKNRTPVKYGVGLSLGLTLTHSDCTHSTVPSETPSPWKLKTPHLSLTPMKVLKRAAISCSTKPSPSATVCSGNRQLPSRSIQSSSSRKFKRYAPFTQQPAIAADAALSVPCLPDSCSLTFPVSAQKSCTHFFCFPYIYIYIYIQKY